ncbi:MAG: BatD family protein [Chromatiales bacterium]|nr:BatD family protein [Chromatiales bacterium]
MKHQQSRTARFCFVCIFISLFATMAHGASRALGLGNNPSPATNTERPWARMTPVSQQSNYRQGPNGYSYSYSYSYSGAAIPGMYQMQPGSSPWGQSPYASNQDVPHIEVELSKDGAFVEETVILTARLMSTGNVKTVNAVLPTSASLAVEQLGDANTRIERIQGGNRVITEYRYALTPLRSGRIAVPRIKMSGSYNTSVKGSTTFELRSEKALDLEASPANPLVDPWLPLHALRVRGQLEERNPAKPGEVFSYTVTLSGHGVSGERLPSVAQRLASPDYKLYLESSDPRTEVSKDGSMLIGERVERYTLVAKRAGAVRMPDVKIAWWNLLSKQQDETVLPGEMFVASAALARTTGEAGTSSPSQGLRGSLTGYWLPLLSVAALLLAYWFGVWTREHQAGRRLRGLFAQGAVAFSRGMNRAWMATGVRAWRARYLLSPAYHYRRLRHRIMIALPLRMRIWYCLRCISCEQNPADWCQLLQIAVCKHLDIPVNTAVGDIAEALIARYPQRRAPALRRLARQLEEGLYGSAPLDFARWKLAFRNLLRPALLPSRRGNVSRRAKLPGLPALNPA